VRRASPLIAIAAALLLAAASASAVVRIKEGVIAKFNGGIHPSSLPRDTPAPVSVHVGGGIRSAAGDPSQLPQLSRITVAINKQGQLFDRGLPVCRVSQIQPATAAAARRICGDALVGSGSVTVQVRIPSQIPFVVRANLLAFNGPRRDGKKLILAQAYANDPPGAFILTFQVKDGEGVRPTILSTTLPPQTRRWAYLTHFELTLHRTYEYQGERRSYVSAACSAPDGFNSALFTFARVTYGFSGGSHLSLAQSGRCRVAE
jgi:hypothetical protein